jgi:hypothetical protein
MIPDFSIIIPARSDAPALGRTLAYLGGLVGIGPADQPPGTPWARERTDAGSPGV